VARPSKFIFAFRSTLGEILNGFLAKIGLRLIQVSANPQYEDVGRTYSDPPTVTPNIKIRPGVSKPFAGEPTIFTVNNGNHTIEEEVFYSHLTLLKMLKHFNFETVLDIGSHAQHVTRIFRHLGKKVTTVEVAPGFEADYKGDYLDIDFPQKFDAIWCSHTLEHQRNVGQFLDKMFDDLCDGGVLALTVPFDLSTNLTFGHCNSFSPLGLLYQLVLAGFDCSGVSLRCYNYNIGIIVKKKYNGIPRHTSFAKVPNTPDKQEILTVDGKQMLKREVVGDEVFDNMAEAFPFPISSEHIVCQNVSINWHAPI
jgi:hypothetical protein